MIDFDYFNTVQVPEDCPLALAASTQQQLINTILPPIVTKTAGGSAFTSIPFVQIHTDVYPQRRNFGNVFRRSASNHEEIKSEPIKSENSDAIKRCDATPTPPVAVRSGSRGTSSDNISTLPSSTETAAGVVNRIQGANTYNGHTVLMIPIVHTCNHCPFMSLSEASLTEHVSTVHSGDLFNGDSGFHNRIQCPGCENVFYAHNSMHTHLREDHMMSLDDAKVIMDAVNGIFVSPEKSVTQNDSISTGITGHKQRKSRIYLKNVDCLREPLREPIEQQENQITENYYQMNTFENNSNSMVNDGFIQMLDVAANMETISFSNATDESINNNPSRPTKQKISIKSVDVLREGPALPRRDYELQSFSNFMNACNDLDLHALNDDQFNYTAAESLINNGLCEKDEANNLDNCEKPRRPKIYIKNVDILKEPITLSGSVSNTQEPNSSNYFISQSLSQGCSSYLNSAENLSAPAQVFDVNLAPLPMNTISEQYIFENANNPFSPSISAPQNFFVTEANENSYILDNARFTNILDCGLDSTNSTSTPILIESTPSPQLPAVHSGSITVEIPLERPQTAPQIQKIFIKNVDILKEPHFQEHRKSIHLRTVDELNLMNKNEVENLIAPNLDNTLSIAGHNGPPVLIEHFHNPKLSDDVPQYEYNNFKLQDFDPQVVAKNWADDYDFIITETVAPASQKTIHDLETPQMTLISIRDIEELTGVPQQISSLFGNQELDEGSFGALRPIETEGIICDEASCETEESATQEDNSNSNYTSASEPKPNQSNAKELPTTVVEKPADVSLTTYPLSSGNFKDIPPLAPVTSTVLSTINQFVAPSAISTTSSTEAIQDNTSTTQIQIPPLASLIQLNVNASKNDAISTTASSAPTERGRIYVANNLLMKEHSSDKTCELKSSVAVSGTTGTSIRGRPFGSNRTGITKMRKLYGNGNEIELGIIKCTIPGCAFRFKKTETLEYHLRCHNRNNSSSLQCPECKSNEFTNWNTLHTHLWRSHKVDMELYSCQLCTFKTPVYSRLINTHSKIHFEDRNYKCDQCDKAFKNTKQLKNHRRWHRNSEINNSAMNPKSLHRCIDCGSAFSNQRTLREHLCKNGADGQLLECEACGRIVSSKSSLKLHMLTHEMTKRFKCRNCDYMSNDHNAFRRHKMVHENIKMYICPYCSYKSIQSSAYQKHIQQNHPDLSDSHIHKCSCCSFSTINRALFIVHQAKHEKKVQQQEGPESSPVDFARMSSTSSSVENTEAENELAISVSNVRSQTAPSRTKIKVKSDLLLSNPLKF